MVHATLVVEDILQEAAVYRVLALEGIPVSIYRTIGLQGAGFIDTNVARLVRASAHGRYIVIRESSGGPSFRRPREGGRVLDNG